MPPFTVTNPAYLYDLAEEILEGASLSLSDVGLNVPGRRFVSPGIIADDVWANECEQLAVRLVRIYTGLPGDETAFPEQCGFARSASFELRITRCITDMDNQATAPTPTDLSGDALVLLSDAYALYINLIERKASGDFLARHQNALIGNLAPHGPQGGVAGVTFQIDVQLLGAVS